MGGRRQPLTVALIGPDGSGKTTIAKRLLESFPLPITYLYMGVSVESSNVALPTSRLVHWWKVHKHKQSLRASGADVPAVVSLHSLEHRNVQRGMLGATARLVNRVAEESYRQVISWVYQRRGYVVLYDRHFLFDCCPTPSDAPPQRWTDRLHRWFLQRVYPKPRLVILLDAPPEVLYARKQEVPTDYLQANRDSLWAKKSFVADFVRVDSTQPVDQVVARVSELILKRCTQSVTRPVSDRQQQIDLSP